MVKYIRKLAKANYSLRKRLARANMLDIACKYIVIKFYFGGQYEYFERY